MSMQKTPDLIKLYIKSCLYGFVLSAVFVALLIGFDVMGLGGLIARSDDGIIAVLMMWMLNGVVFASVQFALAIMGMAEDDDDDDNDKGLMQRLFSSPPRAVPIKVAAPARAGKRD